MVVKVVEGVPRGSSGLFLASMHVRAEGRLENIVAVPGGTGPPPGTVQQRLQGMLHRRWHPARVGSAGRSGCPSDGGWGQSKALIT